MRLGKKSLQGRSALLFGRRVFQRQSNLFVWNNKEFNEALEKKSFYRAEVRNITIGHLS
jgi:hypothetical protein